MDEQADLSLCSAHMSEGMFSHFSTHWTLAHSQACASFVINLYRVPFLTYHIQPNYRTVR